MAVVGPALPLSFVNSILNTDQASGATNGTYTTLTFGADQDAVLNGLIDRPTTSRFRGLVAGYYRCSYGVFGSAGANNKSANFRILKNGTTEVTGFQAEFFSQSGSTLGGGSAKSGIMQLAANDYIELQVAPLTSSAITVQSASSILFELVRPI